MVHAEWRDPTPDPDDPLPTSRDDAADPAAWHIIAGIECVALMIALIMPVTPSKTRSDWSPAALITPDPGYILDVAVYFVLTNLLLAVLALAFVVYQRWTRGDGTRGG